VLGFVKGCSVSQGVSSSKGNMLSAPLGSYLCLWLLRCQPDLLGCHMDPDPDLKQPEDSTCCC
jgi:hypothetical protein